MSKRRRDLIILALVLLLSLAGCGSPEMPAESTSPDTPVPPTLTSEPASTTTATPSDGLTEPTPTTEPAPAARDFHLIYDDDGSRDGTVALLYLLSEPFSKYTGGEHIIWRSPS